MKRKIFPKPGRRQIQAAMGAAVLLAAGFAARQWLTPRTIGVCVVTDYSFRQQRENWREIMERRFAAAQQVFRGTGVRWSFRHDEEPDPTGRIEGIEERRQKLIRAQCQGDVILGLSGQPGIPANGDVPPFAHTAIVVDNPKLPEEQNDRVFAQGLARLFGAPVDGRGAGTLMTQPAESDRLPKAVVKLIGRLAQFDFAKGAAALEGEWGERVFQALSEAHEGRGGNAARAAHRTMALSLAAEEMFGPAIGHLKEAAKLERGDPAAHIELATMYAHNFQAAEAAAEYREAVRLQPDSAQNHAALAVAIANQGKGEEAIEEFQTALRIDPKFATAQAGMAYILSQQLGRIDESIEAYRVAVEMSPDLPAAAQGLERARGFKERSLALAAEQRSKTQLSPSSAGAHFDLGLAEARAGNVEAAVRSFRRALELDAGNGRAHANLAMLLYLQKDYAGALREAGTASKAGFDAPPSLVELLKRKAGQ